MKQLMLLLLLLPVCLYGQLKEFEIREIAAPSGIALMMEHPDCAQLVIHSQIKDLRFESNMAGIRDQRYNAQEEKYIVFISTQRQIITIKAAGYIESQLSGAMNLSAKERKYFSISEKASSSASNKGGFFLDSVPSGAEITIDGIPSFKERTPYRFKDYMAMTYALSLKLNGYKDSNYQMQIKANQEGSETIQLKATFAELVIVCTPPADLYLNSVYKGKTPVNFQGVSGGLASGTYQISLRLAKHQSVEENIVLKAGESMVKRYNLSPQYTELIISSEPSGSTVFMNNLVMGDTPLKLMGAEQGVEAGKYRLRIVPIMSQYNTIETDLDLAAGSVFSKHYDHQDQRRWLKVSANKRPVQVYLDGARNSALEEGQSIEIKSSEAELRVLYTGADKDHYPPYIERVKLLPGEKRDMEIRFSAFKARVNLVSDYQNMSLIIIDSHSGKKHFGGKTDASLELFPGSYTARVKRRYFEPLQVKFTVGNDPEQLVELNPLFQGRKVSAKRNEMVISGLVFAGIGSFAIFSKQRADGFYDDYKKSAISSQAADLRQKTKDWDHLTQYAMMAEVAASAWLINSLRNYLTIKSTEREVKRVQRFDSKQ